MSKRGCIFRNGCKDLHPAPESDGPLDPESVDDYKPARYRSRSATSRPRDVRSQERENKEKDKIKDKPDPVHHGGNNRGNGRSRSKMRRPYHCPKKGTKAVKEELTTRDIQAARMIRDTWEKNKNVFYRKAKSHSRSQSRSRRSSTDSIPPMSSQSSNASQTSIDSRSSSSVGGARAKEQKSSIRSRSVSVSERRLQFNDNPRRHEYDSDSAPSQRESRGGYKEAGNVRGQTYGAEAGQIRRAPMIPNKELEREVEVKRQQMEQEAKKTVKQSMEELKKQESNQKGMDAQAALRRMNSRDRVVEERMEKDKQLLERNMAVAKKAAELIAGGKNKPGQK